MQKASEIDVVHGSSPLPGLADDLAGITAEARLLKGALDSFRHDGPPQEFFDAARVRLDQLAGRLETHHKLAQRLQRSTALSSEAVRALASTFGQGCDDIAGNALLLAGLFAAIASGEQTSVLEVTVARYAADLRQRLEGVLDNAEKLKKGATTNG